MSSAPPPNPPEDNHEKKPETSTPAPSSSSAEAAAMDTAPDVPPPETWDDIPEEIMSLSTDEVLTRIRLIDNDIKVPFLVYCSAYIYSI
jgi:26S proteasome regulatory subunit T5